MTWLLFAGYTTTLVLAEALTIDDSVLEAARVDGATSFQTDMFVVLPLLRKIIGTTHGHGGNLYAADVRPDLHHHQRAAPARLP